MFKRVRNRLLITNMLIIAVFVIACLAAVHITTRHFINSSINARLDNAINMCMRDINRQANGDQRRMGEMQPPLDTRRLPDDAFNTEISAYCDTDGSIISSRSVFEIDDDYSDVIKSLSKAEKASGSVMLSSDSWAYKRVGYESGYIIALTKNASERSIMLMLTILLCIIALVSLVISFLISLLSANRSMRPIEEAYNKQKQFVADASHELRTPLASISANIDVLLSKGDSTIESERKWIEYIGDEALRMTQLTNDLLSLARADDGDGQNIAYGEISLSDIVDDTLLENEAAAFERGVELSGNIEEGIRVNAPESGMKQLILILVDNALKYTPTGGAARMTLKRENDRVKFSIENDGEISKEDLPHIFERFYRADKSRSGDDSGYGLGLAIAAALCRNMGGRIKADSSNGKTKFTLTFKETC